MKSKKDEEEDDAKFCSLKVPIDHEDKDSKTYVVKVKKLRCQGQEIWFRNARRVLEMAFDFE
jgi:hypothetical protein